MLVKNNIQNEKLVFKGPDHSDVMTFPLMHLHFVATAQ